MSSIFYKVVSFKNAKQLKFLLNFVIPDQSFTNLKKTSLFVATSCQINTTQNYLSVSGDATKISLPSVVEDFLLYVKEKDADETIVKLQKMKKGFVRKIPLKEMTVVIDLLVKKEKILDLSSCVQPMSYILDNMNEVLKPLLKEYSNTGDINSLNKIGKVFPDFALMKCNFNYYVTKAYISSEKYEDLLMELKRHMNAKNKFLTSLAFTELLKRPEYEERVVNLAKEYLEHKLDFPLTVVWAHYFTNCNFSKANELFKAYTIPVDKVDTTILKAVSEQENVRMGKLYISALNHVIAGSRSKERAYGTLLHVMVSKEKYEDATALVAKAKENNVDLNNHCRSTLIKLKNALEASKKESTKSL